VSLPATDHATLPESIRSDAQTLWHYHRLDDELHPVDVAIGLGSHDPGVATYTADLYHKGLFPLVVFTGANAPTTVQRFPRGEAVHYREIAIEHGVPSAAVLIETQATNTGENITFTRELLATEGIAPRSVLLTTRPYQQRRAFSTVRKVWPEVDVICSAAQQDLDTYVASIGDPDRIVNMLVGDTQRLDLHAQAGFAIAQQIPDEVQAAYDRLVRAGYTTRLLPAK
jgi:uncharacterized SAM-binding protein YcdF (DUF218 family)